MNKTIYDLLKKNVDFIEKKYTFATEIHNLSRRLIACEKRCDLLEDAVAKLTEIVMSQDVRIKNLENTVIWMQQQIDEMKH